MIVLWRKNIGKTGRLAPIWKTKHNRKESLSNNFPVHQTLPTCLCLVFCSGILSKKHGFTLVLHNYFKSKKKSSWWKISRRNTQVKKSKVKNWQRRTHTHVSAHSTATVDCMLASRPAPTASTESVRSVSFAPLDDPRRPHPHGHRLGGGGCFEWFQLVLIIRNRSCV